MTVASQKRMLTAPNSKLAKTDLPVSALCRLELSNVNLTLTQKLLRQEEAWASLPKETRERLYALLPQPEGDGHLHDAEDHPLRTIYKQYIEEELRCFQTDLVEERETRRWREEALQAGCDRVAGKFDEVLGRRAEASKIEEAEPVIPDGKESNEAEETVQGTENCKPEVK